MHKSEEVTQAVTGLKSWRGDETVLVRFYTGETNSEFEQIVHHQPRNTFYRILGPTKIKTHSGDWVDGFAYQEVKKYGNHTFLSIDSSTIYTRPKELFDSDWKTL